MGAEFFEVCYTGKTAEEAFEKAREAAFYDYGHAGHTGTIAEKENFTEVKVPEGLTTREFVELIEGYQPPSPYTGVRESFAPDTPSTLMEVVRKAAAIADDKWGPALAIEVRKNSWMFMGYASS